MNIPLKRLKKQRQPADNPEGIVFHWGEVHVTADLGQRLEPRVKVLFWAELLVTCGIATVFLLQTLSARGDHGSAVWMRWASCAGAATLYGLAACRFLQRVSFREQVVMDATHVTLVQKDFFRHRSRSYDRAGMGPLRYVGRDIKTDHPLAGRHFDYFGFETHERLVQALHGDGSLYFEYHGYPVRFGRGLYSWHAEELVSMMRLYCGDTLQLGPEWEKMMQDV
jgi:hypothetical protein